MVKTMHNTQPRRKNPGMLRLSAIMLTAIMLTAGCDRNTLLHTYQPLADNCWDRKDTITFVLPELTQDDNGSMLIGLRLTNDFPYEQLVLSVEQDFRHPTVHQADTLFYKLTDERGEFTEEGVSWFQFESLGLPIELKKGQTGEIRIRHLMNRETLPGVTDVGIHIIR